MYSLGFEPAKRRDEATGREGSHRILEETTVETMNKSKDSCTLDVSDQPKTDKIGKMDTANEVL